MKCPECGKWNRAGLPHCVYCGTELPNDAYGVDGIPAWQLELKNQGKPKSYITVDDYGQPEAKDDPRDQLADEMVGLRTRKLTGEEEQRRLREMSASRGMAPSGRTVRTTSNRSTFFSAYQDDPDRSLRSVAPELVEEGEVKPGAKRVYPTRYHTTYAGRDEDDAGEPNASRRTVDGIPYENEQVYDDYQDVSAYIPYDGRQDSREYSMRTKGHRAARRSGFFSARRLVRASLILAIVALALLFGVRFLLPVLQNSGRKDTQVATVTPTIRDDLAAHTVTVPGTDGERITIKELRTSAIVTGGIATFDIPDHIWYDDYEDYLQETMNVTVSPFVVSDSGKQTALPPVSFDIDIPLSPIELITPDSPYEVVSTALYNIVFNVREGSTVTINGEDYSDLVNTEGGRVSYNATVQPIGENTFTIVARSQYSRENSMTVTLYREKQDIPLDLASDIGSSSSDASATMLVRATTLPGAVVKVLSPYSDLNITKTATDGTFSFMARFDKIGTNTIVITADYPGKATTRVEHNVYYVPNIDVYSRKAWDIVTQYTDLMDNLELRRSKNQIYVCKGVITSIETTKPQRAFMNVGTEESPIMIYVENSSKTTWQEGESYRLYGDAYGMYDSKPWLVVRYTYELKKKAS